MEYYNNILCIEAGWLINEGILSESNYKNLKHRGWLKQERRAAKGTPALIAYDSIPDRFKTKIIEKVGDPYKKVKKYGFADQIHPDTDALEYFSKYKLNDGRNLPDETIQEYTANAMVLNAIHNVVSNRVAKRRSLGGGKSQIWESMAESVENVRNEYGHTLPSNVRRLRDKYKAYKDDSYDSLIHKGFCNDNRRKVTADIQELFLSLYALPNKPYATSVHDLYLRFLSGLIEVPDYATGELYNREDFYDEEGKPVMVSESTVWNYLNNPKNKTLVSKVRSGSLEFQSTHRPHHHRHLPEFALSKISMDDRDLPRKMHDGNRVKAYYSYDVASQCVIGASYSKYKDTGLFIDCMRDMFRNINNWGLGMPMEAEVEHHLVNNFKDDLMQAGIVFPFVRWCLPGNSQEKYAEVLNKQKKYGYEKKYQVGVGRFYAKLEANRPKVDKVSDEHNNNYNDKKYDYEKLVADDRETIEAYNNDLHPNQTKYPGMSRMEVLINYQNPDLVNLDNALLARYIGDKTETSIRRSQYVRVQYANYQLPNPQVLESLQPNNYNVNAYYIPDEEGKVDVVYIYQNNRLIGECKKIISYNTAKAEQTEVDDQAYTEQAKYVAQFDKMVKDGKPKKVAVVENTEIPDEPVEIVETIPVNPDEINDYDLDDDIDYAQLSHDAL